MINITQVIKLLNYAFRSDDGVFWVTNGIDVWEGTSGTSADVPRFGLEIYSVSNAILDEYIFKNKFCEIEDLTLFTDRILAK